MRAYAAHVGLLAAGSTFLVPRIGIVGYGWAELLACAGYLLIASSLSKTVCISYRQLLPITAVFLFPLFLQAAKVVHLATLSVPVVLGLALIGYARSDALFGIGRLSGATSRHKRLRHALTFVTKAKQRGFKYVAAVLHHKIRRAAYGLRPTTRCAALSRRADGLVATGKAFHFTAAEIPGIIESVPDKLKTRTIEEADRILDHRFSFRGTEVVFHDRIDWQACPAGNPSWQWDLNRHAFFLLRLGTAHYYTGRREYIHALAELWRDWIDANPRQSANWNEPFEVAARLQNWMWAYHLLAYSGEEHALHTFRAGIAEHADFLASHLEYHWPNNHLLLEAKALYECCLLFPSLDRDQKWFRRTGRLLEREILSQVLPDGAHAELSSMYHRIVAGELSELAALCCRRCGADIPVRDAGPGRSSRDVQAKALSHRVLDRIARMVNFSRALTRNDGSIPLLNDSAADDTYLRFDVANQHYSDLNYWIRRDSQPDTSSGSLRHTLQVFSDAGYAFLRSSDNKVHLTFDCGPFSACSCKNHGHCDALSFELYASGTPLIIDPGVYLPWNDTFGWARHFRSTATHNTLVIDGREQSELSDVCDVNRCARTRWRHRDVSAQTVSGECTPYWSDEVAHRPRIVLADDHQIRIHDEVTGTGTHRLDWTFQFAPELEVYMDRLGQLRAHASRDQTELLMLTTHATTMPHVTLFHGCHHPLRGWVSRDSATPIAATAAVFSMEARLPFEIEFTLNLSDERP